MDDDVVASQLLQKLSSWKGQQESQSHRQVQMRGSLAPRNPSEAPPVRLAQTAAVSGINACEWSAAESAATLTTKGSYLKQLAQGDTPTGNLISVRNLDDFFEIKDQWTAGENFHPVTILIEGRQEVENGRRVQISVKRGRFQMKLEEFTLVSLGIAAPHPRPPKAANLSKFQPEPKVSVRIVAPAHYREGFLESQQWDNARSILLEIAQWKVAQASAISGGTWQWQTVQKCHNLVGHVRVAPHIATGLEAHSGTRGIFVTLPGGARRAEKVKWFRKKEDRDPDNYLRECLAIAKERGQSLKFRMGGGSGVGVMYLPTETMEKSHIQIHIQGIPKLWEADQVMDFLTEQGWSDMTPLSCRMKRRQPVWAFRALPPLDPATNLPSGSTWHYVDSTDGNLQVYVTKATGRFPRPQAVLPATPPRKTFRSRLAEVRVPEVQDTQMDSEEDQPQEEVPDEGTEESQEERNRSRSPQRKPPWCKKACSRRSDAAPAKTSDS